MKEFNEFLIEIMEGIVERLGDNYSVHTEKILKNNECEFVTLLIEKDEDCAERPKVTPAIYMEQWYEMYCDGCIIEDIISEIITIYETSFDGVGDLSGIYGSKENVASHIFFKLVNADNNKRLLEESPHILFEDLAITFHYMCSNDGNMLQSFRVTDSIAKNWEITKQELYDCARLNTPLLFPEKFMSLKSIIMKREEEIYTFDDEIMYGIEHDIPMYVLTNETGFNGASTILYSKYLKRLADKFARDIFILPSSIHEVILVPAGNGLSDRDFRDLVREVNENHVDVIERLSDNVYIYSRKENDISLCK